jgi:hypothetical protein
MPPTISDTCCVVFDPPEVEPEEAEFELFEEEQALRAVTLSAPAAATINIFFVENTILAFLVGEGR